jgi:glycosyltransferase involved in cell wall biosynthesis
MISVVTIAYNEEENIAACLASVQWADELIVVDALSTDRTAEIARTFTDKVFAVQWEGYAAAKQFGLAQAQHPWVLWLDADERVTPELAGEIRGIAGAGEGRYAGYEVARRAYFLGRWIRHCGWYPGYVVRLFRRDAVRFTSSSVHERVECSGEIGRLRHDLLHYTDDNLFHYFAKLNRYTSLAADDLVRSGRRFSLAGVLVRPPFLFFKMYVLRAGFLDGMHGLILSLLSAAYVFTKYLKLWERSSRPAS